MKALNETCPTLEAIRVRAFLYFYYENERRDAFKQGKLQYLPLL